MATHSSILAWRIPCTEEPGGLQSTGWKRAAHNIMTEHKHSTQKSLRAIYNINRMLKYILILYNISMFNYI